MDLNPWAVDSLFKFTYFQCPECDHKSKVNQDFVDHAFSQHPEGAKALYDIKDSSMTDVELPKEDSLEEIDIKPDLNDESDTEFYEDDIKGDFKCLNCQITFESAKQLSNHGCTKEQKENVQELCHICDEKVKNLKRHIKMMHENGLKEFDCSECSKKYPTMQKLKSHLLNEHKLEFKKGSERCLCNICGKTLIGRSNFKKHEREKHGIDNIHRKRIVKSLKLECSKCSENFNETIKLNEHAKDCEGQSKNFSCPDCDSTWASGPILNLHMKKDHNMREIYTCEYCGKCFKRKISVISHIKVEHENIRDHVCHLCGAGFARAQSLKYHIQRVHEHSGKYACEYCGFKTVAQLKLDIHINEVHTKAIKYNCDQCNFFCYRKGGLLAHVKTVHLKLKPHECPKCPEAFGRRKELLKHRQLSNH